VSMTFLRNRFLSGVETPPTNQLPQGSFVRMPTQWIGSSTSNKQLAPGSSLRKAAPAGRSPLYFV